MYMSDLTCLFVGAALFFILIFTVVYVTKTLQKDGTVEDGALMPRGKRRVLTLYLVIFGSCLVSMLVSLTSLDFPATPVIPLPAAFVSPPATATQSPAPTPTPGVPFLRRVFPDIKGETTTTPRLALYGENFSKESKVRFNMQQVPSEYLANNLMTVSMESQYLLGRGSIMVDVVDGAAVSNAIPVRVEKPEARLNVFYCYRPWVTREIQLLLLVIFAGALGSYLHAIMSVTDFIGGRKLVASWFWWYVTRPFLGMAMGLIFYAMLRGGFLAGTPADANVVNPFGVLAIGALVGMFSDKAAQKLSEIFAVVFTSSVARSDKLGDDLPVINKLFPATIDAGGKKPVVVTISGEHLANVVKVRVNKVDRDPDSKDAKEVIFSLTPEDIAKEGRIEIRVVNPGDLLSEIAIITVSNPSPTDATSPQIDSLEPSDVTAGGSDPVSVKIIGERLANVSTVQVEKVDHPTESPSEMEVSFKVNPEEIAHPGELEIVAVSPAGSSQPATLKVSEPPDTDDETTAAETTAAETTAAETTAAETAAAETTAAETTAAETTAAETTADETTASETTADETGAAETTAAETEATESEEGH